MIYHVPEKIVTLEEMNRLLRFLIKSRKVLFEKFLPDEFLPENIVKINIRRIGVDMVAKINNNICKYRYYDDNHKKKNIIKGHQAYAVLKKYVDFPIIEIKGFAAAPLLWHREDIENTRQYAICYDSNSAYAFAMLNDMPDFSRPLYTGIVGHDEIGINEEAELCENGELAIFRYKKMPSYFEKFALTYYKKKKEAKTLEERQKYKEILNFSVGCLQNKNPILRAVIIGYAKKYIKKFIDENTVYVNTDCIISTKKRYDIPISDKMGEFKIEHEGMFAFKNGSYQWDKNKPSFKGIPAEWFPKDFDLLKDKVPDMEDKKYYFDKEKMQLCIKN